MAGTRGWNAESAARTDGNGWVRTDPPWSQKGSRGTRGKAGSWDELIQVTKD